MQKCEHIIGNQSKKHVLNDIYQCAGRVTVNKRNGMTTVWPRGISQEVINPGTGI